MNLIFKVLIYGIIIVAILIFLNLNVKLSLKKRIWFSIFIPLVLAAVFLFLSTLFAFILVIIALILVIWFLIKLGGLFGKRRQIKVR